MLGAEIDTQHTQLIFTKILWKIYWHPPFIVEKLDLVRECPTAMKW